MKLQGIRVLDLSAFLPGPYLTLSMADHGAEVIKVEPPGGEHGRHIGTPPGAFFRNLTRGKKSVVIDLKDPDGREALLALAETADVFVESFRPGVVARLGVDYASVRARNPRIVYCSVSAFGQHGPHVGRPAHELATEGMAGVLSVSLGNDEQPAIPGLPWGDLLAGLQGLSGVLMALLRREATGQGDYVDISMYDAVVGASLNVLGPSLVEDRQPIARHERTTGGSAFYRLYRTRDGRHLALAGQEEKFVRALLQALGRPDLVAPCLQGPGPHQAPVMAFLEESFLERTQAEWLAWLEGRDICYGPVLTFPEMLRDPHLAARGMVLRDEAGSRHIGPPIAFVQEPARPVLRAPALGEHTDALLTGRRTTGNEQEA